MASNNHHPTSVPPAVNSSNQPSHHNDYHISTRNSRAYYEISDKKYLREPERYRMGIHSNFPSSAEKCMDVPKGTIAHCVVDRRSRHWQHQSENIDTIINRSTGTWPRRERDPELTRNYQVIVDNALSTTKTRLKLGNLDFTKLHYFVQPAIRTHVVVPFKVDRWLTADEVSDRP